MALSYAEFSTTQANLLADIRTAILASTDWSRPNAAGKPSLYKATTDRGADMIFDLEDAAITLYKFTIGVWSAHDGTTGTNKNTKYLNWRATGTGTGAATATMPLYVVVSAGKNHIYISVEGPRPNDPSASTAASGSVRNYFFMSSLLPYHATDTQPVVVVGGAPTDGNGYASVTNNNHQVQTSKGRNTTMAWSNGKILSLDFPTMFTADTIAVTRPCAFDNNYYLTPYVLFDDTDGIRGRLTSFHFVGYNTTSDAAEIAAAPVGTRVQFDGQWYKLLAINKSDGSSGNSTWGPFGSITNSGSAAYRSIVVAVPCSAPS